MRRILIAAIAIALALGAFWLSRGSEKPSPEPGPETVVRAGAAPAPGNGGTAKESSTESRGEAGIAAPVRMRSARSAVGGPVSPIAATDSLALAFEKEELDAEEAGKHRELIREVVEELAESAIGTARIEELVCRTRHCKLRIASGDAKGLVKLADALQDERGFFGKAESIMLSRQEDDIVFYLRFSPPK